MLAAGIGLALAVLALIVLRKQGPVTPEADGDRELETAGAGSGHSG
jgi:hypothetical protein